MSDSLRSGFEQFQAFRAELQDERAGLITNGEFGVGLLLGGGWPAAAAALAILLERAFPDERFGWMP